MWAFSDGSIANPKNMRKTFGGKDRIGYKRIWIYTPKKTQARAHQVIADAFLKRIDGKDLVDHINRIRTDNRPENLRWVSSVENCRNSENFKYDFGFLSKDKNGKTTHSYNVAYRIANKEKLQEKIKLWRLKNEEHLKIYRKQYRSKRNAVLK